VVVLVVSIRSLKMHGGVAKANLTAPDPAAVSRGLANMEKHLENIALFGLPAVVSINRFPTDTDEEINLVKARARDLGVEAVLAEVFAKGGAGGMELAEKVIAACDKQNGFHYLYDLELPLKDKIETICRQVYGADGVDYSAEAETTLANFTSMGYGNLPICMAKTQYSLSDNASLLGRPRGFKVQVREVRLSAGAGFVVPITGNIMTMPGLPRHPAALDIDIDANGVITGLF
jgi:formate--tetrahydrofolate ligase